MGEADCAMQYRREIVAYSDGNARDESYTVVSDDGVTSLVRCNA